MPRPVDDDRVDCTIDVRPRQRPSASDGALDICISGELTHCTQGDVVATLTDHRTARVDLDLSSVEFFDAGGVTALLLLRQRYREAGGRLEVQHPTKHVRWVLELVGLAGDLLHSTPAMSPHDATPSVPTGATTSDRPAQQVG